MTDNCLKYVFANKLDLIRQNQQECVNYKSPEGINTLMMASLKGHDEIVSYLLSRGVDTKQLDMLGQNALSYAVLHDQVTTSRILINNGVKIIQNSFGISPLMSAVQKGNFKLVEALQPTAFDINLRASDGWSALYFSIRVQNKDIFDYLVQHGACSSLKDSYNQTPYDFAVGVGWDYASNRLKNAITCEGLAKN